MHRVRSSLPVGATTDDVEVPEKRERRQPSSGRKLAPPISIGLALFLGGYLVLLLPGTSSPDSTGFRTWASLTSWVVQYGGALTVVFCSFRLACRVQAHVAAGGDLTRAAPSAAVRQRRSRAFVVIITGLILMAAAQLSVLLFSVGENGGSNIPLDIAFTALFAVSAVGTYLGPFLTAAGAYLALRRLEQAMKPHEPNQPTSSTTAAGG